MGVLHWSLFSAIDRSSFTDVRILWSGFSFKTALSFWQILPAVIYNVWRSFSIRLACLLPMMYSLRKISSLSCRVPSISDSLVIVMAFDMNAPGMNAIKAYYSGNLRKCGNIL